MWEKMKTSALLVLILVSLQLTRMFWLQAGAQESLVFLSPATTTPSGDSTPASYLDLYAPLHIYVHAGSAHYQLRTPDRQYGEVWEEVKEALSGVAGANQGEEWEFVQSGLTSWQQAASNAFELRYTGQVELNYWWLAADKSTFYRFGDEPLFFDRILIPKQGNVIYFRNLQTNQFWRWRWSEKDNVELLRDITQLSYSSSQRLRAVQVPEGVAIAPQAGLYVSQRLTALPEIMAAPPYRTADKSGIVRQFFSITPRMPRTETLPNGEVVESFITANQQVLSLSNKGWLRYTETVAQSGQGSSTITQQFEQAFSFIGLHGGWPESILADGIKRIGAAGYEFSFVQTYQGYPLIDLNPSTLAVQVAPDGVKSFFSKTYRILKSGYFPFEIRPAEDVLQAIGPELGNRKVSDIYLGYYQMDFIAMNAEQPFDTDPMYLFPVWVIDLDNGQHLLVHAFNLMNDPGVIRSE